MLLGAAAAMGATACDARLTESQGWLFALWRCTHLGCMAPRCETSAWFECPCHGGRFSHTGEWRAGPSERGLDYHPVAVFDDRVHVLTTEVVEGLPAGVEIIESQPRGPHCVGEGQS